MLAAIPRRPPTRRSRPIARRYRPTLEVLEDRFALSTFTVSRLLDDDQPGSLRFAIQQANDTSGADVIDFNLPAGSTIALTSDLPRVFDDLTVTGPGADRLTIDGGNLFRPFLVENEGLVTLTLSGLTLANGSARSESTEPFYSEIAGGAIFAFGNVHATNVVFRGNASSDAGGAIALFFGDLTLIDCTFEANTSGDGGAVALLGEGRASVRGSTFVGNQAAADGGALFVENGSRLAVVNSTFTQNRAEILGGAVYADIDSTAQFQHSTVSGNSAGEAAGGLDVDGASALLAHTIVAGNLVGTEGSLRPSDVRGDLDQNSAYNLIGDGAGMTGVVHGSNGNQVGTATAPLDPRLGPLADNGGPTRTMALLAGSPALDAGDPKFLAPPATDQRGDGFPRVFGPAIDVGAFEVQPPKLATVRGRAWLDADTDGFRDPAEAPAAGVPVRLLTDGGVLVAQTVTDATGFYQFTNLPAGTYQLVFGTGDRTTTTAAFTLVADVPRTLDVGLFFPAQLAGTVFLDVNENGLRDAFDRPLAGIPVRLTGTDQAGNAIDRATATDAAGRYAFADLGPGTYTLTATQFTLLRDGSAFVGSLGGTAAPNQVRNVVVPFAGTGVNYDFSELRTPTTTLLTLGATPALGLPLLLVAGVTRNFPVADPTRLADDAATVTLYDGVTALAVWTLQPGDLGNATFVLPAGLAAGTHRLRVVYAGNSWFQASASGELVVTVASLAVPTIDAPNFLLPPPTADVVPLAGRVARTPAATTIALLFRLDSRVSFFLAVPAPAVTADAVPVPLRVEGAERFDAGALPSLDDRLATPLRPLQLPGVISAAFDADDSVELIERLLRQAPTSAGAVDSSAVEALPPPVVLRETPPSEEQQEVIVLATAPLPEGDGQEGPWHIVLLWAAAGGAVLLLTGPWLKGR